MTTIEHLAVVNLRLARKCALLRKLERDSLAEYGESIAAAFKKQGEAESAAKYSMGCAERSEKARVASEAKLADAERRLTEAATAAASARDEEEARSDRMKTAWAAVGIRVDKAEREVERLRGIIGRVADRVRGEGYAEDAAAILREADAPHAAMKGRFVGPPDGCTPETGIPEHSGLPEVAPPPLAQPKPRRMKANPKHSCEGNPYHGTEHDELASCVTIYLCEPVDATDAEAKP